MPTTKEFTVHMEDRPGTLGKFCRSLADRGINILAFQQYPHEGKSTVRFVVDNPANAKTLLDNQNLTYTETHVVQTKLPHRPGSLASAAARLGEAKININYSYAGTEPGTNAPVVIFGVAEVNQATKILDEVAAAAA
ncbi:MAG TPA: ACT domain-containing protein [Terriglobales bacterium]|nr:ACT domain-containing protein [Terriglobales bacterium]